MNESELKLKKKLQKNGYKVFRNGWPDFMAVKNGKVRCYEVKEGNAKLHAHQRKILNNLHKAGIECFLFHPENGTKQIIPKDTGIPDGPQEYPKRVFLVNLVLTMDADFKKNDIKKMDLNTLVEFISYHECEYQMHVSEIEV